MSVDELLLSFYLSGGKTLVLLAKKNKKGDPIPIERLQLYQSDWFFSAVCQNSKYHGLGNCRCLNHSVYWQRKISEETARQILRKFLWEA